MTRVKTTIWPDREIDVDAAEYLDLQRMGLLVQDAPITPPITPPIIPPIIPPTTPATTGSAPATPPPSSAADPSNPTADKK